MKNNTKKSTAIVELGTATTLTMGNASSGMESFTMKPHYNK